LAYSNEKKAQWIKFRDDYLNLRARLETLPHDLRHDVMVPISKVAFMPGKLVNTNEILVLLGDNWFVEKSARKACELIDRRLASIQSHLDDLTKENDIVSSQLEWTQNLMKVGSFRKHFVIRNMELGCYFLKGTLFLLGKAKFCKY
jgi:unconventional prefoldin RPB5 interactor 1